MLKKYEFLESMEMSKIISEISIFLKDRFDLSSDKETDRKTIEAIRKGVEFKGTNLWVLIFAIFIASIGLNVNSTAVIIGAMLISPLMGPIMGVGLGVGINDFELIKRAFKNLSFAVFISVTTSTIYFFVTPLEEAQSELLARTTPTIWDVMIALMGGLAGIVAITRKDKGNAIPGVAIATALMPPLCTAGYGISTGNIYYFLGAFYLFFINSVFISFSTFLIIRFLKFPKISFIDSVTEKKFKSYIYSIVFLATVPSIYLGYKIVQKSVFESRANKYITHEFVFPKTQLVTKNVSFEKRNIEVLLIGEIIQEESLTTLKNKLKDYNLSDTNIMVKQGLNGSSQSDMSILKSSILEEIYKKNSEKLENKDKQIIFLEEELLKFKKHRESIEDLANELNAQYPNLISFTIGNATSINVRSSEKKQPVIILGKFKNRINSTEKKKILLWLKARLKEEDIKLILE